MENITVEKKEKSIVEISGSISKDTFESYRDEAITYLGKDYEIDGFRKGSVPKELLLKKLPEMFVLEEMAQRAIEKVYRQVLTEKEIPAIGQPKVHIKKIAAGNDLEFSLEVATIPEVKLGDYNTLVSKIEKETAQDVTEKEIEETLLEIRKMHGHREAHGDEPHEHTEDETFDIPELNDEFVQKLGNFKNVAEFTDKVKENLTLEKQGRAKSATRAKMVQALLDASTLEIPDMLVEYELDRFMEQMKHDIAGMGLSYEDYLKHLTKTEEEMRNQYRIDTEKKVKTEFILAEIAKKENITPDEVKVGEQVEGIMQAYKNVDKENVRAYVINMLQNEAVIEFLESKIK